MAPRNLDTAGTAAGVGGGVSGIGAMVINTLSVSIRLPLISPFDPPGHLM